MLQWPAVSNRQYTVLRADNVNGRFRVLESSIEFPQNSFTDTVHGANNNSFYRLEVKHEK